MVAVQIPLSSLVMGFELLKEERDLLGLGRAQAERHSPIGFLRLGRSVAAARDVAPLEW